MLLSALPDVLRIPGALAVFEHLGYPPDLLLFVGTAKILGVVVVLVPRVSRLKEWAFAGLTFDLTGALYPHLSVGDPARVSDAARDRPGIDGRVCISPTARDPAEPTPLRIAAPVSRERRQRHQSD